MTQYSINNFRITTFKGNCALGPISYTGPMNLYYIED